MRISVPLVLVAFALSYAVAGCTALLNWDACETNGDCPSTFPICDSVAGICSAEGGQTSLTPQTLLANGCLKVTGVPFEEALSPDVILVGSLLPRSGDLEQYGPPIDNGVIMAVDDINEVGGVFGKKLALLSCDSGTKAETAKTAAQHMVAAGVQAVIGPASSSVCIDTFNDVFKDAGILTITPSGTAPVLSDLADDGLLWRTCPSDAFQGAAMAGFLKGTSISKIAVVNRDDAYGNGLAQAVRDGLCAPAGTFDCLDDTKFFNRNYDPDAYPTEQTQIALDLEAFQPEVTVLIGFAEDGINFLNLAAQTQVSRRFIVSDGMKTTDLIERVESSEMLCRLLGTQPASPSGENFQRFGLAYGASYDGAQPGAFAANAYDAMYLVGYAYAAAGATATGQQLAQAMTRMSSGETVDVGQGAWNAAIQTLSSGTAATIDFSGASGPLDFDDKGEAPASIEMWAFDVDAVETYTLGEIYSADGIYSPPGDALASLPGKGKACEALIP